MLHGLFPDGELVLRASADFIGPCGAVVDDGLVEFHRNAFQGIGADDHGCGSGIKKEAQGTDAIDAPLHVNTAGSAQLKGNAVNRNIGRLCREKRDQ